MNSLIVLCAINFMLLTSNAYGMFCFPGENIWQVNNNICSVVTLSSSKADACCLSIQDELQSIYGVVTDIDAFLEVLTASNLDVINSLFENLLVNLDIASSTSDVVSSDLNVIASQLDGITSQLDDLADAIIPPIITGTCSCIDVLENCLVGTTITQAMVPYTISVPGNYYLCQSVSSSTPGLSTINIAANNVYLNLNGHTVTNTDTTSITSYGIQCLGQSNVQICNGVINSYIQAIYITNNGGTNNADIQLSDLMVINGANVAIEINNVVNCFVKNCTVDCANGANSIGGSSGIIFVNNGAQIHIVDCFVSNISYTGSIGFVCGNPTGSIEFINCHADNLYNDVDGHMFGFNINQTTGSSQSVVLRNCTVSNVFSNGFALNSNSTNYAGPILENCIAHNNNPTIGGGSIAFFQAGYTGTIYKNCIADTNGYGFYCTDSTNTIYQECTANNNAQYGFYCDDSGGSTPNNNTQYEHCLSTNNLIGFYVRASNTLTTIANSIAAGNAQYGIVNLTSIPTTFIVDCRSQHAATTVNPAYNLNGIEDILEAAVEIITS